MDPRRAMTGQLCLVICILAIITPQIHHAAGADLSEDEGIKDLRTNIDKLRSFSTAQKITNTGIHNSIAVNAENISRHDQILEALEKKVKHLQQDLMEIANNTRQNSAALKAETTVAFDVVLAQNQLHPGPINFTDTVLNFHNAMDAKSGVFTAPVAGLYEFAFHAWNQDRKTASDVYIYKNKNQLIGRAFSYAVGVYGTSFMETLDEGGTVHLQLARGSLYGDFGRTTRFTGKLVRQG